MVTVRNKFDTLQETSETLTPNYEYEIPTWKQQQNAYQLNQKPNVEFHGSH